MANITSAGTGNSNAGATWTGGSVPTSSDNAIIQNGHTVTQNAAHTFKSLKVETGGTWTADGSNHLTLSGENDSDFALQIVDGTYNHANGTVVINNGGGGIAHAAIQGGVGNSTTGLYDLTISGGGTTCEIYGTTTIQRNMEAGGATTVLRGNLTVNGSLTIPATLNTQYSSTDYNLTIVGDISVTGTLQGNASAISSRKLTSTGTLNGGDFTVTGAGLGNTVRTTDLGGTVTGNVDITLTGAGNNRHEDLQAATGNIRNLTVNNAAAVIHTGRDTTIDGDLTITAGTLSTDDSGTSVPLTVAGNTVVDGTLTGNNSTFSFGTDGVHGSTEGGCLLVNSSGTFTFGSGDVTIFSGFTAKGTEGSPNVTSTGGGDIIIKGRTNNGFMNSHSHQGTNITGDYIIDYDATGIFDNRGGTTIACGNFKLVHGGRTYEPWSNSGQDLFKIIGNMLINNGTFDTEYSGQDSQHLTVTGKVDINGGGLTLNASTVNIGNLDQSNGTINGNTSTINLNSGTTGGWVWYRSGGTWNYNTSTVVYKENGKHMEGEFYNLTIECASSTHTGVWRADGIASTIMKCANNLTVKEGIWKRDSASETMTIDGDVSIESGGTLGQTSATGADNFGSLTISGGGTYNSTSGTTTIKNRTGGGYSWYAPSDSHVYNHNNGKTIFDLSATLDNDTYVRGNYWYDLEIKLYNNKEWRYSDIDGEGLIAYNDFTITSGRLKFDTAGDPITVYGLTKLETNGQFGLNSPSGTHTFNGLVTIKGGTWHLSSGTNNMAGIRNVGGTIS